MFEQLYFRFYKVARRCQPPFCVTPLLGIPDICIYFCPVALRALSVTVPPAFSVLAWQGLKENKPTERQKLPKMGIDN